MSSEAPKPIASPESPAALTRRDFVAQSAMAAAAWMIVPRHVLGQGLTPPSDLVNIAIVGIHGMGAANAQAVMSQNIVAICDVDDALRRGRIDAWKRSLQPRPPRHAPAAAPRGLRRRPRSAAPATLPWDVLGPSKLQRAADEKWRPAQGTANLGASSRSSCRA